MNKQRRNLLKGGAALGGAAVFAAGYVPKMNEMGKGLLNGTSGEKTKDRIHGNSLTPEYQVRNAQLISNPEQVVCNTQCFGCWTLCGLRVRVDLQQNKPLRVNGNPYHPLSADHFLPFETSIRDAEISVSGENGLANRSTACARGAAFLDGASSPYRITQVLKRVGKRGEGKWKSISFEQMLEEVVNGGDLFGEGHVDGLKAIRDLDTLVDPENPEFGPKVNQLLVTGAGHEGRQPFLQRFTFNSFGTINYAAHGSFCGLAYRVGSGAVMNDLDKNSHAKPDWDNVEFLLFMGHSPAQSGNPFKRQGRQLAKVRTENRFNYVVVSPRLELTSTISTKNNRWIPIRPTTDLAMALAMLRWIIENERYNADYLSRPSEQAMKQANGVSFSNATHLFIVDKNHPEYGRAVRVQDLFNVPASEKPQDGEIMVKDQATGQIVAAQDCPQAALFVEDTLTFKDGSVVPVKSAMTLLKEQCYKMSLEEYSAECGVPVETIVALAKEFTSHGHKAAAITHGGNMHSRGSYSAWAILLLNVMVGNMNRKGGMCVNAGKFKEFTNGPRYNLVTFPNMLKPKGINLARSRKHYEQSTEYKRKVEQGVSPYPAKAAWYPFVSGQMSEMLTSAMQGYPYKLKAWINHMGNPVYALAGLPVEQLKDPKKIPLFISVDAFMNETTAIADYIVPDTHSFESWGFTSPWGGVPTRTSTARWPILQSKNVKTASGETVCMETFIIELSKAMGLPGFGDNAIEDTNKATYPLNHAKDFFLYAAANVAYDGKQPVADATDEDMLLTGVARLMPEFESTLKPEEVRKVANVYCKGGRFAPYESTWDGDNMNAKWKNAMQLWNEKFATARHYHTGEYYSGCPTYVPARFADGSAIESHYSLAEWPFRLMSFKSNLISSATAPLLRLQAIKPEGIVAMHVLDAKEMGIEQGDLVEISTPAASTRVRIMTIEGVMRGTISIEYGYGHRQLGATGYQIDGKEIAAHPSIGRGINLNELGLTDTTKQIQSPWVDLTCGAAVRQGLPAKLRKISES